MLRTFAHEYTHFLEKWNPTEYNVFRLLMLDTIDSKGESSHDLIESKMVDGMSYDGASREVIAEAMTDILPDTSFMQELAEKNKTVFEKLVEKLKEFLADLKEYCNGLVKNPSREANALKETVGESIKKPTTPETFGFVGFFFCR